MDGMNPRQIRSTPSKPTITREAARGAAVVKVPVLEDLIEWLRNETSTTITVRADGRFALRLMERKCQGGGSRHRKPIIGHSLETVIQEAMKIRHDQTTTEDTGDS